MRSLPSSSSYPLVALSNRLETLFRKAEQLSVLCQIEVCVIYYGPQGELKTWPHEIEKVRDMCVRYSRLNESLRSKKRVNLSEFLKDKDKGLENPNKRRKTSSPKKNVDVLKYPISDHYSPDQIPQLIQSLQLNISTFQRRLRFLESQEKHKLLDHHHQSLASSSSLTTHSLNPSLHQSLASSSSLTTQSLNPSQQFSLFVYNHGDNTLSQIPVSASNLNNQDFSALLQGSQLNNEHNMY